MTEQLIEWAEKRPDLVVRGAAESGAVFTDCEQYRPLLWRVWESGPPLIMWLMLNPSTADETALDPTLKRCSLYSKCWGYGGMIIGNLFDYRATDPHAMKKQDRPNSAHNVPAICRAAKLVPVIVCGWGNHGSHNDQARFIGAWLGNAGVTDRLTALRITKLGQPGHPLYLPKYLRPEPFYLPGHI